VIGVLCLFGTARAQTPAVPADSTVVTVPLRAAAPRDTLRRRAWHDQPRFVMARSLLVPGWGQAHNHAWIKAVLVAGAEGWLGSRIVRDQQALDGWLQELDDVRAGLADTTRTDHAALALREVEVVNLYNARLEQRLARQWQFAAVLAYALVDAYVDANFRHFDVEFRNDPALPPGRDPASPGGRGSTYVRLGLRWDF